ncbi:hypothetical protein V2J09_003762 [Rumex salicifolius]
MGRWTACRLLLHLVSYATPNSSLSAPAFNRTVFQTYRSCISSSGPKNLCSRALSLMPSSNAAFEDEFDYVPAADFGRNDGLRIESRDDGDEVGKIPVKAFFLSTSINLKSLQAENVRNMIPPASRTYNYIALRFRDEPSLCGSTILDEDCFRYMVVFQYGSTILFNIEDHEVDSYLALVKRHASGLLAESRKDDYAVKEKPALAEDMQGGPDYIVIKHLDTDGIRIIATVLGQSVALDYFVSQIDGMVQDFEKINREMEETGTFTLDRNKLFRLVGKANSNLADIILKVGLLDRSEIAWREAKYAQINEYLREEYEVTQRFGNLNYKLKFVEHNIHFLQEALQNRRSNIAEWCIIVLLAIQNVLSIYEILQDAGSL